MNIDEREIRSLIPRLETFLGLGDQPGATQPSVEEEQKLKTEFTTENYNFIRKLCTAIESTGIDPVYVNNAVQYILAALTPLQKAHAADMVALEEFLLSNSGGSDLQQSQTQLITFQNTHKSLMEEHRQFTEKALDYFLMYFGLRVPHEQESDQYYEPFVGEAILSLCMVYGTEWRQEFDKERKVLQPKYFLLCSCIFQMDKHKRYFFHYLLRVAFIFEMSLYCFDNDCDYFELAKNCTYRFVDFLFFRDEGNWTSLKNVASAVAIVTRPLWFAVNCPKNKNVRSLSGVIRLLESYASSGALCVRSREIALLKELDAKLSQVRGSVSDREEPSLSQIPIETRKDLGKTLFAYFKDCLPKKKQITFKMDWDIKWHVDSFCKSLQIFIPDTILLDKALEAHRILSKTDKKSIDETQRREAHLHLLRANRCFEQQTQQKSMFTKACFSFILIPSTNVIPKTDNKSLPSSNGKYFQMHKNYVEAVIGLYSKVIPLFFDRYLPIYLSPVYSLPVVSLRESMIFLIDKTYYDLRLQKLKVFPEFKRIFGFSVQYDDYLKGNVKTGELKVLPINLQQLLDWYIQHEIRMELLNFSPPNLCVPRTPKPGSNCPVWRIVGDLDKVSNTLNIVLDTLEELENNALKTTVFRTCKADTTEAAVQKFRFKTYPREKIAVTENLTSLRPI